VAANRRWGWHQLDSRWAATIVADAGIREGDLVMDLGAGRGAMTVPLLAAGARVLAIELHPQRAAALRATFDAGRVTVIRADVGDLRLPRRPFRVVANPPFAATMGLLRRLTAPGSRLVRADLVVPVHVARRWTQLEAPGAGRWSREFVVSRGRAVPRDAFSPPAPHGTTVLILRRRGTDPSR
jgi:23S rRNA (adenine-N6)-dimethyltransferase